MTREMKNSGIPWIGDVPKEWKKIRIKHIFEIIGGNGFKDKYQGKESGDYPFYKTSDINGDCDYVSTSSNYVDADVVDIENYNIVPVSSIVVSKIGAAMRKNHRKITTCDCCIDNNLQALHPIRTIDDVKYLYYLLKVVNFEWFDNNGTIPSVNNAKLKDLYVPWVSLSEQQRIAEFLDRKCAEVDEMIALQEQIIEELKAYKQSVITEAVTKGLNPAAPMRDSGIEWIGQIPEHWEVKRLKQESTFINGFAFDSEDFKIDEGIKVIRIGDIGLQVDFENCVRATTDASLLLSYRIADGDILIAMSGATTGKCCIVEKAEEAYINQRVGIIRSDVRKLIYYSLLTPYFMEFVNLNNAGSAQPNISSKAIGEFPIIIMPPTEQQSIADYLDDKCADIDSLIQTKQSKIDSLKEYKKSIIYEYVTGKREVE